MAYTVYSSERLRKSGADAETRALLYLMNFHYGCEDVYYFVIDFFNDVTGMTRLADRLWDIQSKADKSPSPKMIGKELITLFKNYISDFIFCSYILFLGGVSSTLRVDHTKNIFGIDNVTDRAKVKLIEGLQEECTEKTYIDGENVDTEKINEFLSKVLFVINDKTNSDYIRAIIKEHPHIIPAEDTLVAIFNEIRDAQAAKKNTSTVEGITIETTDDAINYCRHLTCNEIKMMVLQRIMHQNPLDPKMPISFLCVYQQFPPERQHDQLEQCRSALCRALFNRNCIAGFWGLFETVYKLVVEFPHESINELYRRIDTDILNQCPDFDVVSFKYFIAIVKDGIQQ